MVRRVVYRAVGRLPAPRTDRSRSLVTESDLRDVPSGGRYEVPKGALVTPLARQAALERNVSLVEPGGERPMTSRPAAATAPGRQADSLGKTVALGADHGGYTFKEMLKSHLRDGGYHVVDCGTDGTESVDYPDFALAVAQLVAEGRVWRGIVVDGAGVGSCMAANKVPGVRASLCYDEATALNSRAHNDANVLTLGAGMIGPEVGRQIVTRWLETPAEGGRHSRRVNKIMDIERRYLRKG
jgi:ribose 5-phosphate isomerase B